MVQLQDEPIGDPVCVPLYYVAKLAREAGVVVCQLGEGADELFIGYPSWIEALEAAALERSAGAEHGQAACVRRAGRARVRPDRARRVAAPRRARNEPLFWGGAEAFTDAEKRRLLSPRLAATLTDVTSWDAIRPIRERFERNAPEPIASELDVATSISTCGCRSCC